jgi:4-amino-4-deoxy-L-arabinose transferase-like glycosyltransferase
VIPDAGRSLPAKLKPPASCDTSNVAGLRALTFAALAAVTATLAHGGLATLADPRWATAALGGAAVAALVLWRGWALVARRGQVQDTASLAALIPAMLAAQTAAHLALLAAGAPAHPGAHGSLALHLALAVVAAVLVQLIDVHTQRRALAALTAPRLSEHVVRPAPVAAAPRCLAAWHRRGRAPPLAA